jgi:hypothetical protein
MNGFILITYDYSMMYKGHRQAAWHESYADAMLRNVSMQAEGSWYRIAADVEVCVRGLGADSRCDIVPVLTDGVMRWELPSVVIAGICRGVLLHKLLKGKEGGELRRIYGIGVVKVVLFGRARYHGHLRYETSVPYEPWMKNTRMEVAGILPDNNKTRHKINK